MRFCLIAAWNYEAPELNRSCYGTGKAQYIDNNKQIAVTGGRSHAAPSPLKSASVAALAECVVDQMLTPTGSYLFYEQYDIILTARMWYNAIYCIPKPYIESDIVWELFSCT